MDKIVMATDGSNVSAEALDFGLGLAADEDAPRCSFTSLLRLDNEVGFRGRANADAQLRHLEPRYLAWASVRVCHQKCARGARGPRLASE